MSMNDKIKDSLDELKYSSILGCITGSCLLDADFDTWMTPPDIDVFVYSETAMVQAIMTLEGMCYTPGGKDKTNKGEELKRQWIIESGINRNASLSTIMYERDGVYVNVTYKKGCESVLDVVGGFDMSIIMMGYDIPTGFMLDLRSMSSDDPMVARPNKCKRQLYNHPSRFTVWRALHQWARVPKYYDRGYDTRPMAEFYLGIIDEVLEAGAIFGTDKDIASFEEMAPEFKEIRDTIAGWLEIHKED